MSRAWSSVVVDAHGDAVGRLGHRADPRPVADGAADGAGVVGAEPNHVAAQVGLQRRRRVERDHLAVVDDGDTVTERVGLLHVVGRQHDGDAGLAVQACDVLADGLSRAGVEADGRFVEKEDGGFVEQPAGEFQPAGHPAGVLADRLVAVGGEVHQVEDRLDALAPVLATHPVQPAVEPEVLEAGELLVEGGFLEDDADTRPDRAGCVADVVAGDAGGPLARPEEGTQGVDERRLAGAVRPQQAQYLALGDRDRDVVDGDQVTVAPREPVDFDGVHSSAQRAGRLCRFRRGRALVEQLIERAAESDDRTCLRSNVLLPAASRPA